jgi:apolipoprotein N-acyltransferase
MPTSVIALQILLILLPGFAAAYIVQMLAMRGPQTDFDKIIESCLYSVLIYACFILFTHGFLPFDIIAPKAPATESTILWHRKALLGLAGITVIVALLAVWLFALVRLENHLPYSLAVQSVLKYRAEAFAIPIYNWTRGFAR